MFEEIDIDLLARENFPSDMDGFSFIKIQGLAERQKEGRCQIYSKKEPKGDSVEKNYFLKVLWLNI